MIKSTPINEEISGQEFLDILNSGDIKMKRYAVSENAKLDGFILKETSLPRDVLIGPILRDKEVILPDGNTKLIHGDVIVLFGKDKDLTITRKQLAGEGIIARIKRFLIKLFPCKKDSISLQKKV